MNKRFCKQCGEELLLKNFRGLWQWKERIFCNHKCYSEFKKTIRHSDVYKKRMSEKLKGREITWGDKIRETRLRNKKPKKKRKKIKYLRWYINELQEYDIWRSSIYERDGFKCVKCGQIGGKLVAHHIKHVREILIENNIKNVEDAKSCDELWSTENGITLCSECHKLEHKTKNYMINKVNPEKAVKGGKARAKQMK